MIHKITIIHLQFSFSKLPIRVYIKVDKGFCCVLEKEIKVHVTSLQFLIMDLRDSRPEDFLCSGKAFQTLVSITLLISFTAECYLATFRHDQILH